MPVLQHAKDRGLREEMYRAYVTRAASPKQKDEKEEKREEEKNKEPVVGADGDNTAIIERTLALRKKKAALLRFDCFADLSMASKMATLESSRALLEKLAAAARAPAEKELEEVTAFARSKGFPAEEQLRHWDVSFWAERLREERYELTDEQLRPYFSLPKVLEGLFTLVERLFGVVVEEEPQVRRERSCFFSFFFSKRRKLILSLTHASFLDKKTKTGNRADLEQGRPLPESLLQDYGQAHRVHVPRPVLAARREARRGLDGRGRRPLARLRCLFREGRRKSSPPRRAHGPQLDAARRGQAVADDVPRGEEVFFSGFLLVFFSREWTERKRERGGGGNSLSSPFFSFFRDNKKTSKQVETLFHECGHALQHTLTKQDDGLVSGIRNVEWDAVELPSQW